MPRHIQSTNTKFRFNYSSQASILAIVLLVICLFGLSSAAQAQATTTDSVHYSIPPGSLEKSIGHFARQSGIALAKQRGAYRGRKKSLSDQEIAGLRQRAAAGEKKTTLALEFGISRETLYQYLRVPE